MTQDQDMDKEFADIMAGWIILLEVQPEISRDTEITALRSLLTKGYSGVVLASSRPSSILAAQYTREKIEISRISFVDCVSKAQSPSLKDSESVTYIDNISDLTDISISIHSRLQAIKGDRFLLIDSVPTMLIHNKPEAFARFMHAMFTKLRLEGVVGVMVSTPLSQEHDIRAEIVQLCDQVIKI